MIVFTKPEGAALVDASGQPLTSIRQGLSWDPAVLQDAAKAPSGLLGRARNKAKSLMDGPPKSDLDNNTAFFSDNGDGTLSAVRLSNGSNQYPFQEGADFGPVRASKDATTGTAVGLDEWVDIDLLGLEGWGITCFSTIVSTFDKGNFTTSRNVTCSFSEVPTGDAQVPTLGRILPAIDQSGMNATIAGFGWLQDGVWYYKQARIMGTVIRATTVQDSNENVLKFAAPKVAEQLRQLRAA